jgi:hypothetical protein
MAAVSASASSAGHGREHGRELRQAGLCRPQARARAPPGADASASGVDEDGDATGAHTVELRDALATAGDLAEQPRREEHEEERHNASSIYIYFIYLHRRRPAASRPPRLLDLIQIEVTAFVVERSLDCGVEERGERHRWNPRNTKITHKTVL